MVGSATQADPLGTHAGPGRADTVERSPDEIDGTGRLREGQAYPGRAAQIQRGHPVLGKARQNHILCGRSSEGGREPRQHVAQHREVRLHRRPAEGKRRRRAATPSGDHAVDECEGIVGWRRPPGIRQRGRHHLLHIDNPAAPGHAYRRRIGRMARDHADDGDRTVPAHAVGGGGVEGEAHVGVTGLVDEHDAAVGPVTGRRGQGDLNDFLRLNHDRSLAVMVVIARPPRAH